MTSTHKGRKAELIAMLRASEKGYVVSKPQTEARYDLVVDTGEKMLRAQVKFAGTDANKVQGAVCVNLRRWMGNERVQTRVYTAQEVDLLLVYVAAIDKIVALTPDQFCGKSSINIRYRPAALKSKPSLLASDLFW